MVAALGWRRKGGGQWVGVEVQSLQLTRLILARRGGEGEGGRGSFDVSPLTDVTTVCRPAFRCIPPERQLAVVQRTQ